MPPHHSIINVITEKRGYLKFRCHACNLTRNHCRDCPQQIRGLLRYKLQMQVRTSKKIRAGSQEVQESKQAKVDQREDNSVTPSISQQEHEIRRKAQLFWWTIRAALRSDTIAHTIDSAVYDLKYRVVPMATAKDVVILGQQIRDEALGSNMSRKRLMLQQGKVCRCNSGVSIRDMGYCREP